MGKGKLWAEVQTESKAWGINQANYGCFGGQGD